MKKKGFMLLSMLMVLVLSVGICSAKGKSVEEQAAAQQQATLAKVQQANALCDKFVCRYDEEAKAYTFVPKPDVLGRLSGKAAALIPSVSYAEKDGKVSFHLLFSYAGLDFLGFTEVALDTNGKSFAFAVPEGASTQETATGFVTEDYAATFEGDLIDDIYDGATATDGKSVLRLTGKDTVERELNAYDKAVLKEAVELYRALKK
ncbi:MAG: hypothetical protein SPL39_09240 [Selenomonadaceae bacterium]|nr:hypothetical protein [Selenomonadaceae bacterium]